MKKPGLAALIGLALLWGTAAAQAQIILAPTVGGPGRPGGLFGPSPLFGSPLSGPGLLSGGVGVPYGGFYRPGIGTGMTGPGGSLSGVDTGLTGFGTMNPALDLNQGFVTGHPVAFQNHRGYFLNLNAAAGTPSLVGAVGTSGTTQPGTTPSFGILGSQTTNTPGKRPARPGGK
jgi:hypothetical protein